MRVVAIIQARMNSSRLPGKVLKEISGRPMLGWVVERARQAHRVDEVVVATTTDASDDPVEAYCRAQDYPVYRGNEYDVLDRFYQAACLFHADLIVRITADCPLIDPQVIDEVIKEFVTSDADFAANRLPPPWRRTYPIGLDTEVCSFDALERAWREAEVRYEREHVMPYLYDQEGRFKVVVLNHDPDYGAMRWTVDTLEDLNLLRRIFVSFSDPLSVGWKDVLALFEQQPELASLNAGVKHKTMVDVDLRAEEEEE